MGKTLKIEAGKLMDVSIIPHKQFKGVSSRDLDENDTFEEEDNRGKIVIKKVLKKENRDDGVTVVASQEVI